MPDATPTTPQSVSLDSVDVDEINIRPAITTIHYRLKLTFSDGSETYRDATVRGGGFASCIAAFCQTQPKKKFLQWLVDNGRESNLTIT